MDRFKRWLYSPQIESQKYCLGYLHILVKKYVETSSILIQKCLYSYSQLCRYRWSICSYPNHWLSFGGNFERRIPIYERCEESFTMFAAKWMPCVSIQIFMTRAALLTLLGIN